MRSAGRPVVIAGGGTAGHILPGLAIASALVEEGLDPRRLWWIGAQRGQEARLVTGMDVTLLGGRGVQRRVTPANFAAVAGLLGALGRAVWLIGRRRPAVVLSLGGYASVAASLGAVLWRVPLVVAEQNAVPGLANRIVGRFATACAVPFDGVGLPRAVRCGNPVRAEVLAARSATADGRPAVRSLAKPEVGFPPDRVAVVAFAGSLGSRRINEAVHSLAERWADRGDVYIHHVIGRRDFDSFEPPALGPDAALEYRMVSYEDRMPAILKAADLVVSRSGGTTVAELSVVGVPAVLVPLPIAPGDHQRHNAAALVAEHGAILIDDDRLTGERLDAELSPLLDDPDRREAMAAAAWRIGVPDAARRVARLVLEAADR
ncbi:MAG: UDP-N-acetylglucosamine--N-acetylmuramyl-(pentapeptide) pyrophosphoryl-undecaprenol N-acetylglucosamine transferase [Microthrixaceae bacterium]